VSQRTRKSRLSSLSEDGGARESLGADLGDIFGDEDNAAGAQAGGSGAASGASDDEEPVPVMEKILARRVAQLTAAAAVAGENASGAAAENEAAGAAADGEATAIAGDKAVAGPAALADGNAKVADADGPGKEPAVAGAANAISPSAMKATSSRLAASGKAGVSMALAEAEAAGEDVVSEYLVKWKGLSYIHCEWVVEAIILAQSQGKSRLQRFLRKEATAAMRRDEADVDDELIPEGFITVDRILAEKSTRAGKRKYLIKWAALSYGESTWEAAEDVQDDAKVSEFQQRNKRLSASDVQPLPRPSRDAFVPREQPSFKNDGVLRPYQVEGHNWLVSCWFQRRGCILADEMGLGKTIQSVSLLHFLFEEQNIRGPFLVLAPLSTLGHWAREIDTWTELNAIVYHGNSESRNVIHQHEWVVPGQVPSQGPPYKWQVLITTYETVLQEASRLRRIKWNAIVVDEAHRLKNRSSRLVDELKSFSSDHRVLLTGTPLQNNLLEVWALLNFVDPDAFASEDDFASRFGNMNVAAVNAVKEVLRPYLLRRKKEDVEKSIPPKEETIVMVELTRVQKKWYRALLEKNFSFLDMGARPANIGNLRNIVMELRKCCNHPFLIQGVEPIELEAAVKADKKSKEAKAAAADVSADKVVATPASAEDLMAQVLVDASGKLVFVDKMLPRLKAAGHRVLIFSQMVRVLDILEDYLIAHRWGYERIDGRVRGNERQQAIDRFSKPESEKFVFLLCTRAGGQGINLTIADTVIIYDSDWNPQNDVQAQARCHRIGQQKDVKVFRLITRATYEQDMFDRASKKLGLDQAVLQDMGKGDAIGNLGGLRSTGGSGAGKTGNTFTDLSRNDVDALLKKGAYDVFNEDDSAADAFTNEDIDLILERRTQRIVENTGTQAPSAFSKASFAAEAVPAGEEAIRLDDPDFWKKIMPQIHGKSGESLDPLPRRRRPTQRYAPGQEESSASEMEELPSEDEAFAPTAADFAEPPSPDGAPAGRRLLTKSERHRLQRAIMTFGWGRWAAIRQVACISRRRSVDDTARYVRIILRAVIKVAQSGETVLADLQQRCPFLNEVAAPHREVLSPEAAFATAPNSLGPVASAALDGAIEGVTPAATPAKHDPGADAGAVVNTPAASAGGAHTAPPQPSTAAATLAPPHGETDMYGNLLGEVVETDAEALEQEPVLESPDYLQYLERNCGTMLDRLQMLRELYELYHEGSLRDDQPVPTIGASGSQLIGPWWEDRFDRDLLRGTVKHGYGCHRLLRLDPELVFLGRSEPVSDVLVEDGDDATERQVMEETLDPSLDNAADPTNVVVETAAPEDKDPSAAASTAATATSTAAVMLAGEAVAAVVRPSPLPVDIKPVVASAGKPDSGKAPMSATPDPKTPPLPGAKMEVEQPAMGGNGVVLSLSGAPASAADCTSIEELQSRTWPSVNVLNVRVKKLVRAYMRRRKKEARKLWAEVAAEQVRAAKEERKQAKEAEKEAARSRREQRMAEANMVWSKKERTDFAKFFSIVGGVPLDDAGAPSYVELQRLTGLGRKGPDSLAAYTQRFVRMCLQVVDIEDWAITHASLIADYPYKSDFGEFSAQELEDARVVLPTARRLRERSHELYVLRHKVIASLVRPDGSARLRRCSAALSSDGMPTWWVEDVAGHDALLLRGVARHGFDITELMRIAPLRARAITSALAYYANTPAEADPALPYSMPTPPSTAADLKEGDILNFFPRERAIFSRVQALNQVLLIPDRPPPPPPTRVPAQRRSIPAKVSAVEAPPAPPQAPVADVAEADAAALRRASRKLKRKSMAPHGIGAGISHAGAVRTARVAAPPFPRDPHGVAAHTGERTRRTATARKSSAAAPVMLGDVQAHDQGPPPRQERLSPRPPLAVPVACFEVFDFNLLTPRLLETLKAYKRTPANNYYPVVLPDWDKRQYAFDAPTSGYVSVVDLHGNLISPVDGGVDSSAPHGGGDVPLSGQPQPRARQRQRHRQDQEQQEQQEQFNAQQQQQPLIQAPLPPPHHGHDGAQYRAHPPDGAFGQPPPGSQAGPGPPFDGNFGRGSAETSFHGSLTAQQAALQPSRGARGARLEHQQQQYQQQQQQQRDHLQSEQGRQQLHRESQQPRPLTRQLPRQLLGPSALAQEGEPGGASERRVPLGMDKATREQQQQQLHQQHLQEQQEQRSIAEARSRHAGPSSSHPLAPVRQMDKWSREAQQQQLLQQQQDGEYLQQVRQQQQHHQQPPQQRVVAEARSRHAAASLSHALAPPTARPDKGTPRHAPSIGSRGLHGNGALLGKAPRALNEPRQSLLHRVQRNGDGSPRMPLQLGVLTVENLGVIEYERPGFHTERTLYPIGYRSLRCYLSLVNPDTQCNYVCEVVDDGDVTPKFRVSCSDDPDVFTFLGESPSAAWGQVMVGIRERMPEPRRRQRVNVSGPEYFGFAHVIVQELLQGLPNVDKCVGFVPRVFRRAPGTSAAAAVAAASGHGADSGGTPMDVDARPGAATPPKRRLTGGGGPSSKRKRETAASPHAAPVDAVSGDPAAPVPPAADLRRGSASGDPLATSEGNRRRASVPGNGYASASPPPSSDDESDDAS